MASSLDNSTDKSGRPWAKLSELKVGDKLEADGGFTCMNKGQVFDVQREGARLFIACREEYHDLQGQADDGEHLVGLYKV